MDEFLNAKHDWVEAKTIYHLQLKLDHVHNVLALIDVAVWFETHICFSGVITVPHENSPCESECLAATRSRLASKSCSAIASASISSIRDSCPNWLLVLGSSV